MSIWGSINPTLDIATSLSVLAGIGFYISGRKHELQNQIKEKEKDIARALSSNIVEVTLGAKENINNISEKILRETLREANREQYIIVMKLMEETHYKVQVLQKNLPREIKSRIKSTENTFMSKKINHESIDKACSDFSIRCDIVIYLMTHFHNVLHECLMENKAKYTETEFKLFSLDHYSLCSIGTKVMDSTIRNANIFSGREESYGIDLFEPVKPVEHEPARKIGIMDILCTFTEDLSQTIGTAFFDQ